MKKIKKIGPKSLGKVTGALYGIAGLIGGVVIFLASLFGTLIGNSATPIWFGIAGIIFIPLFYGIIGFLIGAFSAWLYNIVANKFGGIELDIE